MIELLVAVTIISLVITAVSAMVTMSMRLADNNEKHQLALQKAEEALEFFRKERAVRTWTGFSGPLQDAATYCLAVLPPDTAELATQLGECGADEALEAARYRFIRQARVDFTSNDSLVVQINMNWTDGARPKSLVLTQIFENY